MTTTKSQEIAAKIARHRSLDVLLTKDHCKAVIASIATALDEAEARGAEKGRTEEFDRFREAFGTVVTQQEANEMAKRLASLPAPDAIRARGTK